MKFQAYFFLVIKMWSLIDIASILVESSVAGKEMENFVAHFRVKKKMKPFMWRTNMASLVSKQIQCPNLLGSYPWTVARCIARSTSSGVARL